MSLLFPKVLEGLNSGIFETGAYAVPSKSQNSTVLGQGDLVIERNQIFVFQ